MFEVFVVVARELGEALLLIAALRLVARETRRPLVRSPIVWSALAGAIAAALLTTLVTTATLDARVSALITIAFALSVLLAATSTFASANSLYGRVEDTVDSWLQRLARGRAVVGVAFIVAFREMLEVAVFLSRAQTPFWSLDMFITMVLVAVTFTALIGAFRSMATRKSLLIAFRLSALLLALAAVQLLLDGSAALLGALSSAWALRFAPVFEGGTWHAYAVGMLMIPVLIEFVGNWWKETASTVFVERR
ncbi:MAG: hypothetical protein QM639_07225 [Rhodocyclaceae bacterium]